MIRTAAMRVVAGIAIAVAIGVAFFYRERFDAAALESWVHELGAVGPLVFIAIYALGAVLFAPGSVLTLAGGALFGPVGGTLYNLVGATLGATLAFLWYNAHPAQVFMGDIGSLTLGATLAVVALMTGHVLLLPIIGAIFVVEALSVTAQVAYFKLTHGKRLFKMAPIHHHLELLGWSETQITQRFWLIAMLLGMVGIALALI